MNPLSTLVWAGLLAGMASGIDSTVESSFRLQTERFGVPAVSIGAYVYVAGGCANDRVRDDIERIDPAAGTVEVLPGSILPRYFHNGAGYAGRLYLLSGYVYEPSGAVPYSARFEEVDPETGVVAELPPLPEALTRVGVAVHEDRLYVIGGERTGGRRTRAARIYDFKEKTWTQGAEMPVAREGMVAAKDGKIYAPGGYNGRVALTDFQVYDIAADRWERMPDLPIKMSAHSGVIHGDTLYTFGDYEVLNRVAACDLKTGEWSLLDIGYRSSRHNAAVLHGDEVLVIGGNLSPQRPFLNYIQRFPVEKLAAAPRRPWTKKNEPKPEPPSRAVEEEEEDEPSPAPIAAPSGPELSAFELSGKPAPDFELPLLDDSTFRLADHKDRVVVLDFWATWCPPCMKELPHMAALAEEYKDKDVVFLGVSRDRPADKDKIAPVLAEHKVPYPTGLDLQGLGVDYAVGAIPCVVLIGRDGKVQGRQVGAWDTGPDELRKALDKLLAGESLPSAKPLPEEKKQKERRPAVRSWSGKMDRSPELDARFFRLKWRREIEAPETEGFRGTRLELHVPPRRLTVASEESLHILNPADGEPLRTLALPEEARTKDEMDRRPLLVYLQSGASGMVAAVKTKYEVTKTGASSRSFRTLETSIQGFSEEGETVWTHTLEESSGVIQALALPVAADRDYLLVATWNSLLLLNERGEVKLEQDIGFRDHWTIWPGADGKLEVVIRGSDVAGYEWNPLAGE